MNTQCPKCLSRWSADQATVIRRDRVCFSCGSDDRPALISKYLIIGMHHSTKEAQGEMARILSHNVERRDV